MTSSAFAAEARCWICGKQADSREHRLKKRDLVRAYGRGPYRGGTAPVHVRNGRQTPVQGPGADAVKYAPSLCATCNGAVTQPYDRAYDDLVSWVLDNEAEVLASRVIDFEAVYGLRWRERQRNLYKYFAKSFGCRLVDADITVPADVVSLFQAETFSTGLQVSLAVNEAVLEMLPADVRAVFIGKGDLTGWAPRASPKELNEISWSEHVSWLTAVYHYQPLPNDAAAPLWSAIQVISLDSVDSVESLSSEERAELLARTLGDTKS